jgi:limonene-1,2-epoxide hydrolase
MNNNNLKVAESWFEAFNRHDLERLLALYHDQAQHYSPKLKVRIPETLGLIKGKAALRDWWQDAFTRLPGLHYHIIHILTDDNRVFMEYLRSVPGDEDMRVMEALEIEKGLITASRVFHS